MRSEVFSGSPFNDIFDCSRAEFSSLYRTQAVRADDDTDHLYKTQGCGLSATLLTLPTTLTRKTFRQPPSPQLNTTALNATQTNGLERQW